MVKEKRSKSRGYLTPDVKVHPKIVNIVRKLGWKVTTITSAYATAQDDTIALKYGKGRSVLLTYDKTAYTYNPKKRGFIGFIEHSTPQKDFIDSYCLNMKNILSNFTSSNIAGYRIIIDDVAKSYKKVPIKKNK